MPETYLNILEYLARERNFDYTAYCPEMAGRKIKNRISILNASRQDTIMKSNLKS